MLELFLSKIIKKISPCNGVLHIYTLSMYTYVCSVVD